MKIDLLKDRFISHNRCCCHKHGSREKIPCSNTDKYKHIKMFYFTFKNEHDNKAINQHEHQWVNPQP